MELAKEITTKYICSVDLHDKSHYACMMEKDGKILKHHKVVNNFDIFKKQFEPYLKDMTVGVESTHNYYWLLDGCLKEGIPFILGHAYYMKAVRGNKVKNDKHDSKTLGDLMRTTYFPIGYAYPPERRAVRDLLRRRCFYVRRRAGIYAHIHLLHSQQAIIEYKGKEVKNKSQRRELLNNFKDKEIIFSLTIDLNVIDALDKEIKEMDDRLKKIVKIEEEKYFNILNSIPGIGLILALVIIYEIDRISRFEKVQNFSSYCRVVKPQRESNGKKTDNKNSKCGNPLLKWAFSQAVVCIIRSSAAIKAYYTDLKRKKGKTKASCILRHRLACTVYYMLKNEEVFNKQKFLQGYLK